MSLLRLQQLLETDEALTLFIEGEPEITVARLFAAFMAKQFEPERMLESATEDSVKYLSAALATNRLGYTYSEAFNFGTLVWHHTKEMILELHKKLGERRGVEPEDVSEQGQASAPE